jgi:hypothetical protein
MTVEVKLFDSLDDVANAADDALGRGEQARIYDRLSWYQMTQEHCAPEERPLIASAKNGVAAAWLFLFRDSTRSARALASWYTLSFGPVSQGPDKGLLRPIARELSELAHISLYPVADPAVLVRDFEAAGWKAFSQSSSVTWEVEPGSDFASYWANRPGRLRSTVKRKGKKANLDIVIHRDFSENAWADYHAVYLRSWKPDEGSWDFMQAFAESEGKAGNLRLGIAYKDNVPVAAQLWHVENGRATIHKLAYDEAAKAHSPGSILSEAMFRHVIEQDSPDVIDYGTGNDSYKADWMDIARPLYRVDLYNPRQPASWLPLTRRFFSGLVRRGANA